MVNKQYPYQTIDSGLFYKKVIDNLKKNQNIQFLKDINQLNTKNSFIFNSIATNQIHEPKLWQHFKGIEIETQKNIFDDEIFNLMDFNCDQRNNVHFFYTLPFAKNKALVETTWLSKMNDKTLYDYDTQLENYIKETLKIKNYKIKYEEEGAIPFFTQLIKSNKTKLTLAQLDV